MVSMPIAIGEKIPFVHVKFQHPNGRGNADGTWFGIYYPWEHKLLKIDILMLTCSGHQVCKRDEDEKDETITLFKDDKGNEWRSPSEYPTTAERHLQSMEELDERIANGEDMFDSKTLATYLKDVARGIYDFEKTLVTDARADEIENLTRCKNMLQAHYDEVVAQFESTYGQKVVLKEKIFGSGSFRGWYEVTFEQAVAA
jgi:hypothetical protein